MNLRYCMAIADIDLESSRNAKLVMSELGIKYESYTPEAMVDKWLFWNCTNIPKELPPYLTIFDI